MSTLATPSPVVVPRMADLSCDTNTMVLTLHSRGGRIEPDWGEPGILVATASAGRECVVLLKELPHLNEGMCLRAAAPALGSLVMQRLELRHPMLSAIETFWFDATNESAVEAWSLQLIPTDAGMRYDIIPASEAFTAAKKRPECKAELLAAAKGALGAGMKRVLRFS